MPPCRRGILSERSRFFNFSLDSYPTARIIFAGELGCECPEPGYCYTIEHGGYKPKDIDIEYCEKVTKKGTDSAVIKFKDIPAVPLAACLKVFGPYEKLYDNYVELFAYLEKEGYKIVGAPRAVYIDGIWNQEDPAKWLTIIQMPVEKA